MWRFFFKNINFDMKFYDYDYDYDDDDEIALHSLLIFFKF